MSDGQDEWFRTTSSIVWAVISVVVAGFVAVLDAVQDWHPAVTAGAVLFALIAYAAFVRPRIGIVGSDVVLHHVYSSQSFPLAALEKVEARRTMRLRAGGHDYVFGAIGRGRRATRQALRGTPAAPDQDRLGMPSAHAAPAVPTEYADFVEARLSARARDARDRVGVVLGSAEQRALAGSVGRRWDWALISVTVVVLVVFVVVLVLG